MSPSEVFSLLSPTPLFIVPPEQIIHPFIFLTTQSLTTFHPNHPTNPPESSLPVQLPHLTNHLNIYYCQTFDPIQTQHHQPAISSRKKSSQLPNTIAILTDSQPLITHFLRSPTRNPPGLSHHIQKPTQQYHLHLHLHLSQLSVFSPILLSQTRNQSIHQTKSKSPVHS